MLLFVFKQKTAYEITYGFVGSEMCIIYSINREFLEISKVCFIQGRWMEDAIFTASLLIKANKVAYLPLDVHRHLKVAGSAMTSKEPGHYLKVIYDNANAAIAYNKSIINISEPTRPYYISFSFICWKKTQRTTKHLTNITEVKLRNIS